MTSSLLEERLRRSLVNARQCAMPLVMHHGGSDKDRLRPGDPCPWEATETVEGKRLCWVHASAVKAGTRILPK